MSLSVDEQEKQLKQILGPWPNTYTFTKSMAERALKKRKPGHLPVVILRPSIICAAVKEPLIGWVDTLSAAGGLSLAGGTGVLEIVYAEEHNVTDIMPVDYVTNAIVASTALKAGKPGLSVIHSASSQRNPITWKEYLELGLDPIVKQPIPFQLSVPKIYFMKNKKLIKTIFNIRSVYPAKALLMLSKIPGIGSPGLRKNAG
jgi:fatty acyl-CoA reductase